MPHRLVVPLVAFLALVLLVPMAAAQAQSTTTAADLTAGSLLVRARILGVLPEHSGTTINLIGGHLENSNSVTPEFDLSYFLTDHIAIEAETGFLHTSLTAVGTRLGTVSIGKVSSVPLFLMPQFHLLPHGRFNPYVGVGLAIVPYFDAQPAGGRITQLSVSSEAGAVFQWGVDYRVAGPWYLNFDVKKVLLSAHASIDNDLLSASGQVNPWIIGGGVGFRF